MLRVLMTVLGEENQWVALTRRWLNNEQRLQNNLPFYRRAEARSAPGDSAQTQVTQEAIV